jgi:hypothetical protein
VISAGHGLRPHSRDHGLPIHYVASSRGARTWRGESSGLKSRSSNDESHGQRSKGAGLASAAPVLESTLLRYVTSILLQVSNYLDSILFGYDRACRLTRSHTGPPRTSAYS